jgi:pimeloyl-ACP methyl ester carboxylesterase
MNTTHIESPVDGFEPYTEIFGMSNDHRRRSPVVFVHGSWTDGDSWQLVAPVLAADRIAVVYDRRGHSRSPWREPVTRRQDEDDLVNLIEQLDIGPAHLVSNSYGTSIALGVAARRPDLVRSIVGHEPPLLGVASSETTLGRDLLDLQVLAREIAAMIARGDSAGAAERFTDAVLGVGTWAYLPPEIQATFIANAHTFAGMVQDPGYDQVPNLDGIAVPIVLTVGTESPAWLPGIVDEIVALHPHIQCEVYAGAGHIPHLTHPFDLIGTVSRVAGAMDHRAVLATS